MPRKPSTILKSHTHLVDNCEPVEDEPARLADEALVGHRLPTAKDIERACQEIQNGWSKKVRRARTLQPNPRPMVKGKSLTIRRRFDEGTGA